MDKFYFSVAYLQGNEAVRTLCTPAVPRRAAASATNRRGSAMFGCRWVVWRLQTEYHCLWLHTAHRRASCTVWRPSVPFCISSMPRQALANCSSVVHTTLTACAPNSLYVLVTFFAVCQYFLRLDCCKDSHNNKIHCSCACSTAVMR